MELSTTEQPFWTEADIISRYTRTQAIEDGLLVPTTDLVPDEDMATQAGYRCPVAMTAALAALVTPTDAEKGRCQDVKGRLWDLLFMGRGAASASARSNCEPRFFRCIFDVSGREDYATSNGRRYTGRKTLAFKVAVHAGDNGEAVCTISLPGED